MEPSGRRYIVYGSRKWTPFKFWNFADLHTFNRACAKDRLAEDIALVKDDPSSFWLGGGDYGEFIGLDDKRFDPDCVSDHVSLKDMGQIGKVQTEHIRDLLKPIAHKCVGLLKGNHEKKFELHTSQSNLHEWLCVELGVPNLEYSAMFDLVFTRKPSHRGKPQLVDSLEKAKPNQDMFNTHPFRVFAHHGAGFAQTPGGKMNRLIGFMNGWDVDIIMVGHVHDHTAKRVVTLGADSKCRRVIEREKIGLVTGSYLRTYAAGVTTYAEQRGYAPVPLGARCVQIDPEGRHKLAALI